MRARFFFTVALIAAATSLLGWGAFVTSIDAGMAVPDWPTTYKSYDPLNPLTEWWLIPPVLAEHGHRLIGAVVGLLTLILAVWTWFSDHRKWMRQVALAALALVIVQGVLGGLRVVFVSMDLAVVHASLAQLFYSLVVAMALFTSETWTRFKGSPSATLLAATSPSRLIAAAGPLAVLAVYIQIILGALLRHPGTGIDPLLAGIHMGWAYVATTFVVLHALMLRQSISHSPATRRLSIGLFVLVGLQVALGLFAYFVLLDERGMLRPSSLQVTVNATHLITGAVLLASNVVGVLLHRRAHHVSLEAAS